MNTTVAIVGAGDTSNKAPISSKIDVWGLNEYASSMKKLDLWFQLHSREIIDNNEKDKTHLDKLKKSKCPIMMQTKHTDIPQSMEFPLSKYQRIHGNKFASTIDYMMAHAIGLGYKKIELYGVDMMATMEYGSQRPTCLYFIGYALGKGIEVWIHPDSGILKDDLYGFRDSNELGKVIKQLDTYEEKILELEKSISYADGVITTLKDLLGKDYEAIEGERVKLAEELFGVLGRREIATARYNKLMGNNRDVDYKKY